MIAALTSVRGLGRWTADWFLARHLARPHAWPAGDLGVRKAVSTFYADGRSLSIEEVRAHERAVRAVREPVGAVPARGREDGGVSLMEVRRAAAEDFEAVAELWRQFDHEIPPPTHEGPADVEQELAEVRGDHRLGDRVRGARTTTGRRSDSRSPGGGRRGSGRSTDLYVAREARRSGIGTELMREVLAAFRAADIEHLDLEVLASNHVARSLYARWGLKDEVMIMTGDGGRARGEAREPGGGVVRLDPPPVGRPERRRAGRPPVRPAPPGRFPRVARRAAARRLDRGLRRRVRPQPGDAAAAGTRALRPHGRRDVHCSASSARSSCG